MLSKSNVPISKQGYSTTPICGCSRGKHEEDFPHKTTEDATQQNTQPNYIKC